MQEPDDWDINNTLSIFVLQLMRNFNKVVKNERHLPYYFAKILYFCETFLLYYSHLLQSKLP